MLSNQRRIQDCNLRFYLDPGFDCKPEDRVYYVACAYRFCEILRTRLQGQPPKNREKGWRLAATYNKGEALKLLLSNRSEDEISVYLVALVALKTDPDTLDWVLRESKIKKSQHWSTSWSINGKKGRR